MADCRAKKAGAPKVAGAGRLARSLEHGADYEETTMGYQSAGSIELGCRSLEYGTLPDDDSELFVVCGRCDFIDDAEEVPAGWDLCDEAFPTVPTDDFIADASGQAPSHPADEAGRS